MHTPFHERRRRQTDALRITLADPVSSITGLSPVELLASPHHRLEHDGDEIQTTHGVQTRQLLRRATVGTIIKPHIDLTLLDPSKYAAVSQVLGPADRASPITRVSSRLCEDSPLGQIHDDFETIRPRSPKYASSQSPRRPSIESTVTHRAKTMVTVDTASMDVDHLDPLSAAGLRSKQVDDAKEMQKVVAERASRTGDEIPPYDFLELIGKGAFGRVYKWYAADLRNLFTLLTPETVEAGRLETLLPSKSSMWTKKTFDRTTNSRTKP